MRARIIPTAEAQRTEPKQISLSVPHGQFELAAITEPALERQLLDATPHRGSRG